MKKLCTLILCIILTLQLCVSVVLAGETGAAEGSTASGGDQGLPGVWKLVEMNDDGDITTKEQLEQMEAWGMVMYLDIRADGTMTASGFGTDSEGTWNEKEIITNGSTIFWSLDGAVLTLEKDSSSMKFERTTMDVINAVLGYKEGVLDESVSYSQEEEVLLDTDEILAKIRGYKADASGFTATVSCENKTDKKMIVSAAKCVVNRYVIPPSWAVSLEAGESKETTMTCSVAELEKCGISAVDELILEFKAVDPETYEVVAEHEMATVYPTGKKKEDIQTEERTPAEKEAVVLDNEDVLFVIQSAGENSLMGYALHCYFENRGDKTLTLMWTATSVNDKEATSLYAVEALPGTRGYNDGYFMTKTLEEAGIKTEDVKVVKGTLNVYDSSGDVPAIIYQQEFTFEP